MIATLGKVTGEVIFDGEIVAWKHDEDGGHAMPFSSLQQRLGRKQVSEELLADVPVAYAVFDVISGPDGVALDRPLLERNGILDGLFPADGRIDPEPLRGQQAKLLFEDEKPVSGWVLRAPIRRADSAEELEAYFEQAMARGNEGR